jgi:hypothetical protein
MALAVAGEVAGLDIEDAALVHVADGEMPGSHEVS